MTTFSVYCKYLLWFKQVGKNTCRIGIFGIDDGTVGILLNDEVLDLFDDAFDKWTGTCHRHECHARIEVEVDVRRRLVEQNVGESHVTLEKGDSQWGGLSSKTDIQTVDKFLSSLCKQASMLIP